MNMKKLGESLQKRTQDVEGTLKDLESKAKALRQKADHRRKLEAKIEDIQVRIEDGSSRLVGLREQWSEAAWNEDWNLQEQLQQRRRDIEDEIATLSQDLQAKQNELAGVIVPGAEVAEILVLVELFQLPDYQELIRAIEDDLRDKQDEIRGRLDTLRISTIPTEYFDQDHYDTFRHSLDPSHPSAEMKKLVAV